MSRPWGVETKALITGIRCNLTAPLGRRSAIAAEIGHIKADGRLSRCPLNGTLGDAIFAVICGCGHNIRKILAHLRALLAFILTSILRVIRIENDNLTHGQRGKD